MTRSIVRTLGTAALLRRKLLSQLWRWEAARRGAELRGSVLFLGRPILTLAPGSHLIFQGENEIFSDPRCNALGNALPCVLRTLEAGATLEIGRRVGMSSTMLCASAGITIGEGTLFGAGAMVIDSDLHWPEGDWSWRDARADEARAVRIGRGCFIGARAIILKGVTLGDRVVVGAGAVVTKDVPDGMRAVGNPARNVARAGPEAMLA